MPDMTKFYAMQDRLSRDRQAAVERIRSVPLIGSEWSSPRFCHFAAVVPGQEKKFRICYFDAIGFSGHAERDDPTDELIMTFGSKIEA